MAYNSKQPIAIQWNQLTLDAIKCSQTSPPLAARALSMVHTAMYDAWSVYHACPISTNTALYMKVPDDQYDKEKVRKSFSYAAYRVLMELFWLVLPAENKDMFRDFMCELGYDPDDTSLLYNTPAGIGNLAARMVIECRNGDGSNPHGTLAMPSWSDYTGYQPVNTPDHINDISKWQPQKKEISPGVFKIQSFLVPHWGLVKPFALHYNWQFRPDPPCKESEKEFREQAQEILDISACLTDEQKMIAEYWADGPGTFTPPGHWCEIAQYVLRNETKNSTCIKLFFAISNALLDASIACWECKHYYDSARPVYVIRYLFENEDVQAWAGPCKGTRTIKGRQWQSYIDTPPFPEHVSGHSTFSRAAAVILKNFTGSDSFGGCYKVKKGCSRLEPGCNIPGSDVSLDWPTFSAAADQAGMSRLYGGIHFRKANELGLKLGNYIGTQAWEKALFYFND
jgi:hypothetical protein